MKRLVLTFAILIGLAAPAWAGFAEGVAAYNRGDYATALREFRPLAGQGDAKAQVNLGFMYGEGQGVAQDYAEAVKWFRKAAGQGNTGGQNNLGIMYDKGRGVPQDYAKAAKWYRKAAGQGVAEAQYNLGLMYHKGQGVPQDFGEAMKWWRKAAKQKATPRPRSTSASCTTRAEASRRTMYKPTCGTTSPPHACRPTRTATWLSRTVTLLPS